MHNNKLKIVGCGGHSKVIIDALSLYEPAMELSFCSDNIDLLGKDLYGIPVDSTNESLSDFSGYVHVAIGHNQGRKNVIKLLGSRAILYTIIHPAAVISKSAYIGKGSFIAALAVLGPESSVGEGSIINHGAIVDHEVIIGDCTHVAPNCTLGGRATLGAGVLVGAGATILPGISVGDGAIIAAGAVVVKNVKENTCVKGVPAL
jgi:sugar O-acyltransferase (sialic acid O-acetyltransferase NeuD family)